MIVNWEDLETYYGSDISIHRDHLNRAHQATYAMLACKWSSADPARFANQSNEHAEGRLLQSTVWREDVPSALDSRTDLDKQPMIVTLAINRSPCGHCAYMLAKALQELQFNFARRFENSVFLLASLGYYHSNKYLSPEHEQRHPESNQPLWVTTQRGLESLKNAGWHLAALSFDGKLTRRGGEFARFIG